MTCKHSGADAGSVLLIHTAAVMLASCSLLCALAGCADGGKNMAGAVIGSEGGTIVTDDGLTVTVPAGALETPVEITIETVDTSSLAAAEPAWAPYAGPAFAFTPHGQIFAEPVTIRLPATTRPSAILRLDDTADPCWQMVPGLERDDTGIEFATDTFSVYVPAGSVSGAGGGQFSYEVNATVQHCIPVAGAPGVEICEDKHVDWIELVEESTAEILASCDFDGDGAGRPSAGGDYRFSCTRSSDPQTGAATITITSAQANLPTVHVYWTSIDPDGLAGIHFEEYIRPLHLTAGSSTFTDPYTQKDYDFAGGKRYTFFTTEKNAFDFMNEQAVKPLTDAGYTAWLSSFNSDESGSTAIVDVFDTYDGRVKMEQDVIFKNGWKVRQDPLSNRGNAGSYQYSAPLSIGLTPLFVNDLPTSGEKHVSGTISVSKGSEGVTDATVTLNGTPIPHWTEGLYDVEAADIQGLGPDSTVTVVVTTADPQETKTLHVTCPPALEFVTPAENSLIGPNDSLTVNWAPGIPYDHAMRIAGGAMIGQFACYTQAEGSEVTSLGHGDWFVSLTAGQTSQAIEVDDCRRYLIELQYPGEEVQIMEDDGTFLYGYCTIRNRMWLQGQE